MITGRHLVRDVLCAKCQTKLGWMYEYAMEDSQRYKEGKVILEEALIVEVRDSGELENVTGTHSTTTTTATNDDDGGPVRGGADGQGVARGDSGVLGGDEDDESSLLESEAPVAFLHIPATYWLPLLSFLQKKTLLHFIIITYSIRISFEFINWYYIHV